jgi:hypothetical protein
MAQLSSPGVSVTVIDESFYTPAAPGTVPLIIIASEESKQNGAGTGTAAGTLKANAGQVYLLTSQKDLSDTFGTPVFKTDANNNPIHAGEQNEYGLQAAYSFLGVSNRAFVVRADVDTAQLNATATAPAGNPEDGTFWFDTANTKFGVFEWNSADADVTGGQTFINKVPTIITDPTKLDGYSNDGSYTGIKNNVGAVGSYAVVAVSTLNKLWYKKPATNTAAHIWVEVGSEAWKASWPTAQGTKAVTTLDPTLSMTINGSIALSASSLGDATGGLVKAINDAAITGIKAANIDGRLNLYSNGTGANDGNVVLTGTLLTVLGFSLPVSPATSVTYKLPALAISAHTAVPTYKRSDAPTTVNGSATGSIWVKTTTPNLGADWIVKKYNAASAGWSTQIAPIYATNAAALKGIDPAGGGISLAVGQLYVKYNDDEGTVPEANFKIYARSAVGATVITSKVLENATFTGTGLAPTTYEFTISETRAGNDTFSTPVSVVFTGTSSAADRAGLLTAIQAALPSSTNVRAELNSSNKLVLSHTQGGDIRLVDVQNDPIALIFPLATTANLVANPTGTAKNYVATLWTATVAGSAVAVPSASAPSTVTANGRLWYNSIVDEVDIMVHNGTHWVGYQHFTQNQVGGDATDPNGPIVSATKPTVQSDGTALANGDLWIDSGDTENYPQIYKYNYLTKKWLLVDSSDQTTENGILFADARWATSGTTATPSLIVDLLSSDFLDFDAPDPALYPKGMLLWNLRRSGFNVKRFVRDYVDTLAKNKRYNGVDGVAGAVGDGSSMTGYYPHRWLSEAANQENGAGTFGRKAQRKVVVQALQALVNSNQQIRDEESRIFNLMACPGYPELIGELVSLNYDRGLTAFVVGDTPARLTPDATSLSNWGNNVNGALEDNDRGLVSFDEYLGCFYPWGFTSDNLGNNVVVPPSHMMLRTIALSDNVSYPWFAPAGTRRGGITNASAVGYVDAEGEFRSVALNNGQRDTLAGIKVNPLTFITGTGLVNYGQYTRAKNASSLDRINVARLVIYLRRQLTQLSKPYVFEPNDKITRDEIKGAAESLMLELVGQRALYDYIVVCDTSNNTPARIDRSELYLDIAIEPVKAVEFIYIPLRLKNTGEIKGLA